MKSEIHAVPGWYGKIPYLGDFASRRLPQQFVNAWDDWLQHSLVASRSQLGTHWLHIYLNSPIWRFILLPRVIDDAFWTGLIMPSVDKVGRHFPLSLAVALDPEPGLVTTIIAAQDWFESLEETSLAALDTQFSTQDLEARLEAIPFPLDADDQADPVAADLAAWLHQPSGWLDTALQPGGTLTSTVSQAANQLLEATCHGTSLWWCAAEPSKQTRLCGFAGLPPPQFYASLLQGQNLENAATLRSRDSEPVNSPPAEYR